MKKLLVHTTKSRARGCDTVVHAIHDIIPPNIFIEVACKGCYSGVTGSAIGCGDFGLNHRHVVAILALLHAFANNIGCIHSNKINDFIRMAVCLHR